MAGRHISINQRKSLRGGPNHPFKGKRGSGARFKAAVAHFSHEKGVRNPKGLAGAIARSKYGNKGLAKMAAKGRRRH
jgi:hypothetical protein